MTAEQGYHIPGEGVESSNIAAIGYDPLRQVLAVTFKSGDVFHYSGVDNDLALEFYAAESKGRFYSQRIKGKLSGMKMTGGKCPNCGNEPGYVGDTCDDCGTAKFVDTYEPKP